jgi:hypothetical protein
MWVSFSVTATTHQVVTEYSEVDISFLWRIKDTNLSDKYSELQNVYMRTYIVLDVNPFTPNDL